VNKISQSEQEFYVIEEEHLKQFNWKDSVFPLATENEGRKVKEFESIERREQQRQESETGSCIAPERQVLKDILCKGAQEQKKLKVNIYSNSWISNSDADLNISYNCQSLSSKVRDSDTLKNRRKTWAHITIPKISKSYDSEES